MKPTKDLALLAERIFEIDEHGQYYKLNGEYFCWIWSWNPTESAYQCLMVLEWLAESGCDVRIWTYKGMTQCKIEVVHIKAWYEDEDFKTAVTLAAIEYIKQ